MSLIDVIVGKIVPHDCMSCGREGGLLCQNCLNALPLAPSCCYRCYLSTAHGRTCNNCLASSNLDAVSVVNTYGGVAKRLIWQLKLAGAQEAASLIATQLRRLIDDSMRNTVLVPVPTATSRVRRRGYDQARLIARELSRQTSLPCYNLLARSGQQHQHGLSRQQRLKQLKQAYRVRSGRLVQDINIILIDDVITTGATLEAAAQSLRNHGAGKISALVFARPKLTEADVILTN